MPVLQAAKLSDTQPDDHIFRSWKTRHKGKATEGAIYPNQVREIVTKGGERAGINGVSCHWFRHSHFSHTLDNDASAQLINSSVTISRRYVHAKPSLHLPF